MALYTFNNNTFNTNNISRVSAINTQDVIIDINENMYNQKYYFYIVTTCEIYKSPLYDTSTEAETQRKIIVGLVT